MSEILIPDFSCNLTPTQESTKLFERKETPFSHHDDIFDVVFFLFVRSKTKEIQ